MSMKSRAESLIDGIKGLTNKIIMRDVDLRSIANIDSEDLRLLKDTNDLLEESYDFVIDEIKMIEQTHDEIYVIKKKLDEQDRKLDRILEQMRRKKDE